MLLHILANLIPALAQLIDDFLECFNSPGLLNLSRNRG